jgi:hypothetical protein
MTLRAAHQSPVSTRASSELSAVWKSERFPAQLVVSFQIHFPFSSDDSTLSTISLIFTELSAAAAAAGRASREIIVKIIPILDPELNRRTRCRVTKGIILPREFNLKFHPIYSIWEISNGMMKKYNRRKAVAAARNTRLTRYMRGIFRISHVPETFLRLPPREYRISMIREA